MFLKNYDLNAIQIQNLVLDFHSDFVLHCAIFKKDIFSEMQCNLCKNTKFPSEIKIAITNCNQNSSNQMFNYSL